jgi:CheY-like chemotaxis protein
MSIASFASMPETETEAEDPEVIDEVAWARAALPPRLRLLIVEDHEPLRRLLVSCLEHAGYSVGWAANGDGVIERLQTESFDIVITDVIMPGKEGVQLMLELRELYPALKLIAMSGGGAMGAEIYLGIAKKLGVKAALRKPFSARTLLSTINQVAAA